MLEALDESKGAILSQAEPPLPQRTSNLGSVNDRRLRSLQVLSAHIKLLLDAPEHLWRLIDRKKYLPAAWLFLLTRVVHRALVRSEEHDEETWNNLGIDVLDEFPLIQRQWDAVSQFRSQIIHKATLFLREMISPEDACATLITLHLLDSRPLSDTLSALLGQRSKALQLNLSWRVDEKTPAEYSTTTGLVMNGHAKLPSSNVSVRRHYTREVTQAIQKTLGTISQTVCSARRIFQDGGDNSSLIVHALQSIQSESLESSADHLPPTEIYQSTHTLLTNLTSSAHFHLLPPSLRSYRPYVDIDSSSAHLSQAKFVGKLQDWFQHSTGQWRASTEVWMSSIQSVREVWTLRSSIRRWVASSRLEEQEKSQISSMQDDLCHERILAIWRFELAHASDAFKTQLGLTLSSISRQEQETRLETPLDILFRPTPAPVLSQTLKLNPDTPFRKYQAMLKGQLIGRTTQLDEVLSTLERCASTIQQDLAHIMGVEMEADTAMVERLTRAYQPAAESTSAGIVHMLECIVVDVIDNSEISIHDIVFVAQLLDSLMVSSNFITQIGCGHSAMQSFKVKTAALHDRMIDRWRECTITRIFRENNLHQPKHTTIATVPSGPSPPLFRSFLSLSAAIQQLGILRHQPRRDIIIQSTLQSMITSWVDNEPQQLDEQHLQDLAFLLVVVDLFGSVWADLSQSLEGRLKTHIYPTLAVNDLRRNATEYLARTQTLFSVLLPQVSHGNSGNPPPDAGDKLSSFLLFGTPSSSQQYHSAIELVKPSSRFGLLLVGNMDLST